MSDVRARGLTPDIWHLTSTPLTGCFLDRAASDATGADVHAANRPGNHHADALQIGQPPSAAHVVRMADPVSEYWRFPTNFTHLGHGLLLQVEKAVILNSDADLCNPDDERRPAKPRIFNARQKLLC